MTELLKKIPLKYKGELHHIKLINFSIEPNELKDILPKDIKPYLINNRAIISMVHVHLEKMRPHFIPPKLHFNYQHIAFRLLIHDPSKENNSPSKSIYFLQSFCNKNWVAFAGKLMTNYKLEGAKIKTNNESLELKLNEHIINYQVNPRKDVSKQKHMLYQDIAAVDRAYAYIGKHLHKTQIMREEWPIEEIECSHFNTNIFKTARFEVAYEVKKKIDYTWLPPEKVS